MSIIKDVGQYLKVRSANKLKKELSEGFTALGPLGNRIVIEAAKEEERAVGGTVLVSAAKEKPQTGIVVAIGGGRLLENGEKVPAAVKAGDQVMFEKYVGTEIEYKEEEYLIIAGKDIMAIVE